MKKIWKLYIRLLRFLRLIDERGNLSITNLGIYWFGYLFGKILTGINIGSASITEISAVAVTLIPVVGSMLMYDRKKVRSGEVINQTQNVDMVNEKGE